jgi:ABC-type branched-subunit amino acid transport system ATPase component/ABC-type branched-subunit amino acid transport system permease subunit
MKRRIPMWALLILLGVAPLIFSDYYVTLFNYIGLASITTLGVVLLTGVGGLTSFGQAAFVGIGAYATAVMTTQYGVSPWLTLPCGLVLVFFISLFLGFITLRLSGHYLPLGTIAWGIAIYYVFGNLDLLGKYSGIAEVPPLSVLGWQLIDSRSYYYLIWSLTLLVLFAIRNLLDSRSGRAIRALRGRSVMAENFGVDTARLKIIIFVYAALLAALSGWLYAHFLRFVSPHPFNLNGSIDYLFMAVIGGSAEVWGAIFGAALLTLLKEWLKDLLPKIMEQSGNFEIIVFGLLVIFMLHRAREGLTPYLARFFSTDAKVALAYDASPLPRRSQPSGGEPLLRLSQVSKSFGALAAVKDLSFELRAGEILGLIGPNGAGKSTVFNLVTGVLTIDDGEILFRDQRIEDRSSREIALYGIARTYQHVNILPSMSILENAAIGAYRRGTKGVWSASLRFDRAEEASLRREAAECLDMVGLARNMSEPAGTLPLGSQRLLEIARAMCADPLVLLLDEPAAGLRYHEKQALAQLLRTLRRRGLSILLVEHDMEFVMGLVDRIVVMNFGERLAEGAPKQIQSNPAVIEAYLGSVA